MAKRKPIKGRGLAVAIDMPEQDKHQKMISEMHNVLHSLSDKIRKPFPNPADTNNLLPSTLQAKAPPEAAMAKQHIETLHKAVKSAAKGA